MKTRVMCGFAIGIVLLTGAFSDGNKTEFSVSNHTVEAPLTTDTDNSDIPVIKTRSLEMSGDNQL